METNETPYDNPIAQWQETIDDGMAMLESIRERLEFATTQRDKLVLGRLRWLGELPVQETIDFS